MTRRFAGVLVAVLVTITSGCEIGQDDEMAPPPTRTVTRTPTPSATPRVVPTQVPVGEGRVGPGSVVWAQESALHVGTRQVDLSPLSIDSFVVVAGGVFFLARGELWFTDLTRARGTGFTGVTRLSTTSDSDALRVEVAAGSGPANTYAFDLATGKSMPADQAVPATDADLRGTEERVVLRPGGSAGPTSSAASVQARMGPGRFGVVGGDGERLVVFEASTRRRVPLKGVVGAGFELVRWQGRLAFYGLAFDGDKKPLAMVSCNLTSRSCTTSGKIDPGRSLALERAA